MRKFLCLLLTVLTAFPMLTACDVVRTAAKKVLLYKPSNIADVYPRVYPDQVLASRFCATTSFCAVGVTLASGIELTVRIFKWKDNIQTTLSGEALAEGKITTTTWLESTFSFNKLPKGEYVVAICSEENFLTPFVTARFNGVKTYIDGRAYKNMNAKFTLTYASTPHSDYGSLSTSADVPYTVDFEEPVTAPDAAVITRDVYADTYVATDALGRTLPTNEETSDVRDDKFVGMFFWSWHSYDANGTYAVHNNAKILAELKEKGLSIGDYPWTDSYGKNHYWDEPIWGYYKSTDDWVLMRQAQLLANAGVDAIFFDCTNATFTWKTEYEHVFSVFEKALKSGIKVPKVAFMLPFGNNNDNTKEDFSLLYYDIYEKGRFQDLWFYWDGKPLILADPQNLSNLSAADKVFLDFFTFRDCTAAYVSSGFPNTWNWLCVYPQGVNCDSDGNREQISVSVAQNAADNYRQTKVWSHLSNIAWNKDVTMLDRAYTYKNGASENPETDMLYGLNFVEQWELALEEDPEFVFVTGWNEWTACNFTTDNEQPLFVDQFSPLASRDCEPSKGVLKDNYYYQLVSYIRKFKGTRSARIASEAKTIDITGDMSQWSDVFPEFYAYTGDVEDRDTQGFAGQYYTDYTGRNDIALAKVAHDGENLYFYVETVDNLTPYTDNAWMRLYLDIGESEESWEGYEYIVNRVSPTENKAYLERLNSDFTAASSAEVEYTVNGKVLQIKIPKSLLGITGDKFTVNFKWSDNVQTDGDIMDFYTSGDVAPEGRFMYSYIVK